MPWKGGLRLAFITRCFFGEVRVEPSGGEPETDSLPSLAGRRVAIQP